MVKGQEVVIGIDKYICVGKWHGDYVFSSIEPNKDMVLIYTDGEIKEIINSKPKVEYDRKSPQCSIGYLLKACSQALRKERRITDFNDLRDKVLASKGYEDAYACMREYVELIDISEVKHYETDGNVSNATGNKKRY